MTHELKCWTEYFAGIMSGNKTFEIRKNDRSFQPGDTLLLKEYAPSLGYSGRKLRAEVTYILFSAPEFGLHPDYCIMSLKLIG